MRWRGIKSISFFHADVDECAIAPCQNEGTSVDHVNDYLCQRVPGQELCVKVTVNLEDVFFPRTEEEAQDTLSQPSAGVPTTILNTDIEIRRALVLCY